MKKLSIALLALAFIGGGCTSGITVDGQQATFKEAVGVAKQAVQLQTLMQEHAELIVETQVAGVFEQEWEDRAKEATDFVDDGNLLEAEAILLEINAEMRAALEVE